MSNLHLPKGTLLKGGDYKIVRHISSGGFGNTYEAIDIMMDERVAIKEFFPKDFCNRDESTQHITLATQSKHELVEKLRQKFIEEAKAIFKMKHNNIVRVHTFFEENGTAYYVMEYVEGQSLNDILKTKGSIPESEALGYICQVADALKHVHQQNRLHLDIKPGNIMVDATGKAVLIDFGASKHYDEGNGECTTTMQGLNTPGYAPYEQTVEGVTEFSPAADIYALGATLYKLVTGETPMSSGMRAINREDTISLPPFVSSATCNAVVAAMRLHAEDRPQSIDEFLKILNTEIGDEETKENDDDDTLVEVGTSTESETDRIRRIAKERLEAEKKKRDAEEKAKAEKEARERKKREEEAAIQAEIERLKKEEEKRNVFREEKDAIYFRINGKEYKMVKVIGGTFDMKETVSSGFLGLSSKEVVQRTTLSTYYIGETQVTQALWKAVMGNNPSRFKDDNLPVECVSWNDCQEFVKKLNSLTGKCFRLPTEAEWEFAARGGNKSNHTEYSGSNKLDEVAWYDGNSGSKTHPVATKRPNELGIYDMTGNVWEWCSDWCGSYCSNSLADPTGPNSGTDRVNRGGSWYSNAGSCRVSNRSSDTPDRSNSLLGLRLCLSE